MATLATWMKQSANSSRHVLSRAPVLAQVVSITVKVGNRLASALLVFRAEGGYCFVKGVQLPARNFHRHKPIRGTDGYRGP